MTVPAGAGDLALDNADLAGDEGVSGVEGVDAAALAKALAAKAVEGNDQPQDSRGITHEGVEGEVEETPEAQAQKAAEEAEAAKAAEAGAEGTDVTYGELEQALAEAGIDLGVSAKDIPKELLPVYEKLVQSAVDVAESVLSQQLEASKALQAVNEFSDQLNKSPDKVMLALAVNQPEVYKKVAARMADMEADPRERDRILSELASEARMREVERKERLLDERDRRSKANQVIAATQRAARTYGVPFNTAEKVIALAVQANNGNLDLTEVDGIVRELKGLAPAKTPGKTQQRIVTPKQQQALQNAPKGAVGGSETSAGQGGYVPPGVSKGLKDASSDREGGGGKFRGIIQSINRRLAGAGQ